MKVRLLVCSVLLLVVQGEYNEDEWLDPTDMLNYDSSSMKMRKSRLDTVEVKNYDEVQTKKEECAPCRTQTLNCPTQMVKCPAEKIECPAQVVRCPDINECQSKVSSLQREVQEQKNKMVSAAWETSCRPVFKRYLSKILKGIEKLGLPDKANSAVHCDAEIKLTRAGLSEVQKFLSGDDSWKPGALDEALSQMLVNFKLHDYEAWKWRFEDTFGVELYTILWVCASVLMISVTISTELWSKVSWFTQCKRLLVICFIISIFWNWLYLYKVAFAAHKKKMVELESSSDKCTGVKKMDWMDSLIEWRRRTFTLQDDPCKEYYELLLINPLLLVPPTEAIAVTITKFFTEPMKHVGQGISEFMVALLKDLPITLQIPVLVTIVLSIVVFTYGCAQSLIQHALPWPGRGHRQALPPPAGEQPRARQLRGANPETVAWGDSDPPALAHGRQAHMVRELSHVRRRQCHQLRERPRARAVLRNLGDASDDTESEEEWSVELSEMEDTPGGAHGGAPAGGAVRKEGEKLRRRKRNDGHLQPGTGCSNPGIQNSSRQTEQQSNAHSEGTEVPDFTRERTSPTPKPPVETIGLPTQDTFPRLPS
ncbi:hypothetical protein AGOR_G00239760 [Albula goreensis]|uniref:Chloride channel CLIC-like protein 1 n=1 Tax=Albula goreensis TaxID=1534307 RepID=A0A8T3CGC9_9TELE|nr:hypothetical protein AGOR_G00239760 [Albula goreensis]